MHVMQRGDSYKELPDVKIIFISKFDVFHAGHAMYHVDRVIRETGQRVENGQSEIYVNAKVKDGTLVAELMQYFMDSNGRKEICPKLSERVMLFKTKQEEVTAMCELMEQERLAGREEGREEGKILERVQTIARLIEEKGMGFEEACEFMQVQKDDYQNYRIKIEEYKKSNK